MLEYQTFIKKYSILILFVFLFIVFFILSFLSKGTYGGGDDFEHYSFARWAFVHPYLFLDHWAKPLFTILASPFAQFGYMGIKTFNILTGLATAWLTFFICKDLKIKYSWLVIFFVCFAPVYLSMLMTGMTEILFGFTLILAVFFAFRNKLILSAVVLSLLPFVRNEGIVVIPFFLIYFIINRKYIAIPFIVSGFIFFSLIGYVYYHDLFWVITKMPYTGAKELYGSGPLLHFVNETKSIFGIPLTVLFLSGLLIIPLRLLKPDKSNKKNINYKSIQILLLVVLPLFSYYVTHSILWWKGWGGSFGLIRVIAGVVPLFAIIAMDVLGGLLDIIAANWLKAFIIIVILYLIISTPFKVYQIPVPEDEGQTVLREAAAWVHNNGYDKNRIYYYDPYFCFALHADPFDQTKTMEQKPRGEVPSKDLTPGNVIVWDTRFGDFQGEMPLERFMNDSFLRLIKVFEPLHKYEILTGKIYEVCIFERINDKINISENFSLYKQSIKGRLNDTVPSMSEPLPINKLIDTCGFFSYVNLNKKNPFSPGIDTPAVKIFRDNGDSLLMFVSAKISTVDYMQGPYLHLIVSLENNSEHELYNSYNINLFPVKKGQSFEISKLLRINTPARANEHLKIYFWNTSSGTIDINDLCIRKILPLK